MSYKPALHGKTALPNFNIYAWLIFTFGALTNLIFIAPCAIDILIIKSS